MVSPGIEPHYMVKTLFNDRLQNTAGERVLSLEINGDVTNANVDVFSGSEGKDKLNKVIMTAVGDITVKVTRRTSAESPFLNGIHAMAADAATSSSPTPVPSPNRDILKLNVGDMDGVDYDYTPDVPGYVKSESKVGRNTNNITLTGEATSRFVYHSERFTGGPSLDFDIPVPAGGQ